MGSPPPFLVILCVSVSVFYKKASEIKHVNFIVDILVYDELKNVVQNLLLLRELKVPLPKIRPFFLMSCNLQKMYYTCFIFNKIMF
jgi:hypothetical protein